MEGKPPNGAASWQAFAESIPVYDSVDKALLYQNDPTPFHIVLDVAVLNVVSANGLIYDAEMISAMEAQLPGLGGLRGHLSEGAWSAYPIEAVDWVGHTRVGDTIYAKGYIAPGPDREAVRRTIARGGELRTSLDVQAFQEWIDKKAGTYRLREIEFFTIDLVNAKKAALAKATSGQAFITRETKAQEEQMPEDQVNLTEQFVESLRSQVRTLEEQRNTAQAQLQEAQTALAAAQTEIQETRQYASLVGEIRLSLGYGENVDNTLLVPRITEMDKQLTELLAFQQEATRREAERQLDTLIGSYTESWVIRSEAGKAKLAAFHKGFKRAILAETKAGETTDVVAARVWQEEFQEMAQSILFSIAGPNAVVPPANSKKETAALSDEQLHQMATRLLPR